MKILKNMRPPKLIGLGFLIVIIIGTALLTLPISSANGEFTNIIDALFTAASATCITGLAVLVTGEHWSLFGQIVIMLLVQIGGLGFMAFVTMAFVALGKRITLRDRILMRESYSTDNLKGAVKFIKHICKFTIGAEGVGALILSIRFCPQFGFLKGIYYGIFHSISAFCNAGFDLFGSSSIIDFSGDYILLAVLMLLIITGGIGFPVFMDLYIMIKNVFNKKYRLGLGLKKLKIHSKLALITTAFLTIFGAVFFAAMECGNAETIGNMPLGEKLASSMFQSVTLRTAGFASIDQAGLTDGSKIMSILLMFVGGSPASTAGGAKTVTVAVVVVSAITLIKGEDKVKIFKRTLTLSTIRKSLAVIITMMFMIFASVIILTITEQNSVFIHDALDIFYEVVSAICTVGTSTGITPYLSDFGKIIIIICMYIGRIGPVTMAMIFTSNSVKTSVEYPEGKIIVG